MKRRELLKSLAALPFVKIVAGDKKVDVLEIDSKKKYIIFIEGSQRLENFLVQEDHPLAYAPIFPILLGSGQSIEDVVAIYELDEKEPSQS